MNTMLRKHDDKGMSLVEVLVAVFLLTVVGSIVAGITIAAMKSSRSTASGIEGEAQLNDAVARIARDIAVADPIVFTSTGTGWTKPTPAVDDLWIQAVANNKCSRTRYWLDTSTTPTALKSTTQTYPSNGCPDPRLPDTTTTAVTKTVVANFKTTDHNNTPVKLFTYYDKANNEIAAPVTRTNTANIARVKIDVGANIRERPNGVRLTTSVALRSINGTLVTGSPAPACFTILGSSGTENIDGADMVVASDATYVPTPIITWQDVDYADTFTLQRKHPVTGVWSTLYTGAANPNTVMDPAMRGYHSRVIEYQLTMVGPGGSTTCLQSITQAGAKPAAPAITVTVTPDTSSGPHTSDFTQSTANITWSAVPQADRYAIYKRPIDPNTAPFNYTSINWIWDANVDGATSYNAPMAFDTAWEWKVIAIDLDFEDDEPSADSNIAKTLAHNAAPNFTAVAINRCANEATTTCTNGANQITWTPAAATTVDGYRVWKRPTGTSAWGLASGNLSAATTTFSDTAGLGTEYDYMVTAYNQGPRGTAYTSGAGTIYYGRNSNTRAALQYPPVPVMLAHGTENGFNPDGRNSIQWSPVSTMGPAPTYEVWKYFDLQGTTGGTWSYWGAGGATSSTETGQSRGSRNAYVVISRNATGYSQNHNTTNGGAVRQAQAAADNYNNQTGAAGADGYPDGVAYQRPVTPTVTKTRTPGLNDLDGSYSFTGTGDAGDSGEPFCGRVSNGTPNTGACQYQVQRYNNRGGDGNPNAVYPYGGGYDTMGANITASTWGVRDYVYFNACNLGGCSDWTYQTLDAYPGPFGVTWQRPTTSIDEAWVNRGGDVNGYPNAEQASGYFNWQTSENGEPYLYEAAPYAGDPWAAATTESYWANNAQRYSQNKYRVPGASYYANVTANSPYNGLTRQIQGRVSIEPARPARQQTTKACSNAATDPGGDGTRGGWKPGRRFLRNAVASIDINGNGVRGPWKDEWMWGNFDHIRSTELVGRPGDYADGGGDWFQFLKWAETNWEFNGNRETEPNGTWIDQAAQPAYYNSLGWRAFYWRVYGSTPVADWAMNPTSTPIAGGTWANDNKYVYDGEGWGGGMMLQTYAPQANPVAQQGDYQSGRTFTAERIALNTNNVECENGIGGWGNVADTVGQRGHYPWLVGHNPNLPYGSRANSWNNEG